MFFLFLEGVMAKEKNDRSIVKVIFLDWIKKSEKVDNIPLSLGYRYRIKPEEFIDEFYKLELIYKDKDRVLLTDKGINLLKKYDFIVKAHYDPDIDVYDILYIKSLRKDLIDYRDLKWNLLNRKALKFINDKAFTCLELNYFKMGRQIVLDGRGLVYALKFIILSMLISLSGLCDTHKSVYRKESAHIHDYVYNEFQNIYMQVGESGYNKAFHNALIVFHFMRIETAINIVNIEHIKEAIKSHKGALEAADQIQKGIL